MSIEDESFERLKTFLWGCVCDFCVVYQGNKSEPIGELKWCGAFSLKKRTPKENDKLAAKYQEVAMHCYEHKRSLILNENLPSASSKNQRWCGLNVRANTRTPTPANSLGQRWWHLVVASGATRKAGYVIVARVAAKESKEVNDYISKIQDIMA